VVLAAPEAAGAVVALDPEESHYVARVVRARVGDPLTATDGAGAVMRLRVAAVGRRVEVEVEQVTHATRPRELVVACGAPEGERADWLVEKLAELGAATLVPLQCERAGWERFARRAERLARVARAALRQSRQPHALTLATPAPVADWASGFGAIPGPRWLADPDGAAAGGLRAPAAGRVVIAVGPSSGFSDDERSGLQENGFHPMSLAPTRLRTETAAVAAAAWWAAAPGAAGGG
jgi:16S rRNA (uracil1498-N3)-methyltransferase